MPKINSLQKSAIAVTGAVCLTLIAAHNPTEGYDFTEQAYGGKFRAKEEWKHDRAGCTQELFKEMHRLKAEIYNSDMTPIEKTAATMSGRPVEIYKKCMEVTTWNELSAVESEPFWKWHSRGAFHHILSPVKNILYALALIAAWVAAILFALRSPTNQKTN